MFSICSKPPSDDTEQLILQTQIGFHGKDLNFRYLNKKSQQVEFIWVVL